MFTIIISEKGGADRREAFDRSEINVGRVQGNDLMLAKGNVSKHHARLLYRDGRFIVTDLKSTNGTYVNGRKISQATIVREGDKIYVGDFVLRLETGNSGASEAPGEAAAVRSSNRASASAARNAALSSAPPAGRTVPPPSPGVPVVAGGANGGQSPPFPVRREPQSSVSHVSHFPLEREPDSESAPDLLAQVPGSGRVREDSSGNSPDGTGPLAIRVGEVSSVERLPSDVLARGMRPADGETPEQVAYRRTLAALIERVGDLIDLSPLAASDAVENGLSQRIDEAVQRQGRAMLAEGSAASSVDVEQLSRDALRELLGLGPIGPLLEDEEVSEVHVAHYDSVLVVGSGAPAFALPAFTSEAGLARAVARLIGQSGVPARPDEWVVERRLARGARMVALMPPVASGVSLTIRKGRRVQATLAGLLSARAVSSSMVAFLAACVEARSNVLVVGSGTAAVVSTIAALLSTARAGERIAIVGGADEIVVGDASAIALPADDGGTQGAESVRAATRLGTDRLVVMSLAGDVAAATVDAIGGGCEGVIAGVRAPSLRHAVARLAAQVALARPGASIEVAREAVGESFDVAVELSRPGDGRLRVLRVAELAGADVNGVTIRDLFVAASAAESRGGTTPDFAATGARPRFTQEFAARGIKLDEGLFKKAKSQSQ